MENQYNIEIDMMAQGSWLAYCQFNIGKNKEEAFQIFSQLQDNEKGLLRFTLMEKEQENKVLLTKYCTLNSLEKNCKIITKEIFRIFNFE